MNKTKLKELLAIQSYSGQTTNMFNYLVKIAKANNYQVYNEDGNIYITKGKANVYPCIVAHTDTVHTIVEDLTIIELSGKLTGFNAVTMEQTGIGGDDKAGIFIALQCLEYFDNIKVAFFEDEETGCNGSYLADMSFFDNCSFVLQCDRKGNNDFITNASGVQLSSKAFYKAIKPILKHYSYKQNFGLMTDVMALKENGLEICCANISCGYYNPHTANEYINLHDLSVCLELVKDIISQYGQTVFKHVYKGYSYAEYSKPLNTYIKPYFDPYEDYLKKTYKIEDDFCECCNERVKDGLQYSSDYNTYLCKKCYAWVNNVKI